MGNNYLHFLNVSSERAADMIKNEIPQAIQQVVGQRLK